MIHVISRFIHQSQRKHYVQVYVQFVFYQYLHISFLNHSEDATELCAPFTSIEYCIATKNKPLHKSGTSHLILELHTVYVDKLNCMSELQSPPVKKSTDFVRTRPISSVGWDGSNFKYRYVHIAAHVHFCSLIKNKPLDKSGTSHD